MLGCAELVAPNGGVDIVVAPDTVEINEQLSPPVIKLDFVIRNTNPYIIAVSPCAPDLERETAADVWQVVKVAEDCLPEPMPAGTRRSFVAFVHSIEPGHYRLRAGYSVPGQEGISVTEKPTLTQTSNTFVVVP
jgi:hypothetical protein